MNSKVWYIKDDLKSNYYGVNYKSKSKIITLAKVCCEEFGLDLCVYDKLGRLNYYYKIQNRNSEKNGQITKKMF